MAMSTALAGFYDYRLVALSVLIAILAAYAGLDLAGRVTAARGFARIAWLHCGALAMGTGIWAMHYIGMEAFRLPVPVLYDWPTVLLSLLAAIAASTMALFVVSRPALSIFQTLIGSVFMGGGIASMHYIGMEAMRLPAMCVYSSRLVVLSVGLAIAISYVALRLTFASRTTNAFCTWRKVGSGLVMGCAIPVMHYVGMAAARFLPTSIIDGNLTHAINVSSLGLVSITIISLVMLTLVFVSSAVDRQFARQAQQLADSHLQLQAVFDNVTEGILIVDHSHQIMHMNHAAARLFNLPYQTGSRKRFMDSFEAVLPGGEALPLDQWPSERALRGEFLLDHEMGIREKATGKLVNVEISSAPIRNINGEPSQILISLRNLMDRKRMNEVQTRLAAIVESSEDAIIGKNLQAVVTSWNSGATKIFGYTPGEMIGQSIKVLLPPGYEHEEDQILTQIMRGETVHHIETVRKRKDGLLIDVSLTISPIRDVGGSIVGASKIARDISEKKRMERQLHQSQKMDAIGQLTGGIAHDFNNLLGIVLGNLDLVEGVVASNEIALDQVNTAQRAATRGADLTRRLLSFARMEDLKPSTISLNASIENMLAMATRALGPEIAITTQLDASLPRVFVDASGLESALLNLVVNARDAMSHGGSIAISTRLINLEETYTPVKVAELKAGWYACVTISDTGAGMSKEVLERACEPFFTTKQRDRGTGLGLAMVYGFAKQSGGTVRIYSEVGRGTTVSIYLPLDERSSEQNIAPVDEHPDRTLSGTVLVVDDEADLLKIAAAYLAEMGLTALQAIDGASALEIVKRERAIDLMVTDIVMPGGMNGVELAQCIHELNPKMKIIYSSGFPADALAERRMSLLDGLLLHKPYQRAEFRAIIRNVLEQTSSEFK